MKERDNQLDAILDRVKREPVIVIEELRIAILATAALFQYTLNNETLTAVVTLLGFAASIYGSKRLRDAVSPVAMQEDTEQDSDFLDMEENYA